MNADIVFQIESGEMIRQALLPRGAEIGADQTLPVKRNGCLVNNFWNSSKGGTPLTIDVTETGKNGSKVYVYWVNATNATIKITSMASANYYYP